MIHYFKGKGWSPKSAVGNGLKPFPTKKYDDLGKRDAYAATPAQLRMIEAMWHDIYRGNDETKHLRQFLFNHFKVSDIRFLEKNTTAHQVIEALKQMKTRLPVQRQTGRIDADTDESANVREGPLQDL